MRIARPNAEWRNLERPGGMIVWITLILLATAIPWRLLSSGYLPPDDALRHAAKAVSGKAWPEILVMRSDITMDHNPGWAWILEAGHRSGNMDATALVQFSVLSMFLLFVLAPALGLKRPEAWIASLAVIFLVFPYFTQRALVGRPLFVTMSVSLVLLSLWTRVGTESNPRLLVCSVLLIGLAVWIHGAWYLPGFLPLVFLLAKEWRKGLHLTFCWLIGAVLGAVATGRPVAFLEQAVLIVLLSLGQNAPENSLVGEFQPFTGSYPALFLIAGIVLWRRLTGRKLDVLLRDPLLWLVLIGMCLGFRVLRFWLDWGVPALALWLARQFEELLLDRAATPQRLGLTALASLLFAIAVLNDQNGRWSQSGKIEALDASRPNQAEWLPQAGGILYNVDLAVFYQTFFRNPTGDWRYILGFEPSFMKEEDLEVYQNLWRTLNATKACEPWVQRMTRADRLVLRGGPGTRPAIRGLEWNHPLPNTWVGRLPR